MASFGFLDRLLRDGAELGEELKDAAKAGAFLRRAVPWILGLGAYYGFVMGAFSLFEKGVPWFSVADMIKVPLLLLGTAALCAPALYVFAIAGGATLGLRPLLAALAAAQVMLVLLLASLSPVVLFFLTTFDRYAPAKLIQVLVWAIAGLFALRFLRRLLVRIDPALGSKPGLMLGWMLLFGLVGMQGAWMMRPFLGAPNQRFQVFRHAGGNIFENLVNTVAGERHEAAEPEPPAEN